MCVCVCLGSMKKRETVISLWEVYVMDPVFFCKKESEMEIRKEKTRRVIATAEAHYRCYRSDMLLPY